MACTTFKLTTWAVLVALIALVATGCGGDKQDEGKADTSAKAASTDDELPAGLTAEQAAKVVAKVGQSMITVGDVTRQINRLSPYIRRRWAAPEKRKEFLDKLVRVELLSQEAERLGLRDDPEIQRTLKQVMIRLFVKDELEKMRQAQWENECIDRWAQEDRKYDQELRSKMHIVRSELEDRDMRDAQESAKREQQIEQAGDNDHE